MSWFGRDCGQVGSVVKSSGALGHPGRCQALSSHGRSRCQVMNFWVRYAVMSLLLLVVKSKSLGRVALVSWFGRDCGQVGSVVKSSGALGHPGRCEALSSRGRSRCQVIHFWVRYAVMSLLLLVVAYAEHHFQNSTRPRFSFCYALLLQSVSVLLNQLHHACW